MPDLTDLPPWSTTALDILLIAIAATVAYLVVRLAVDVSLRHLLERIRAEAGQEGVVTAEQERRLRTIGRLAMRVAGTAIVVIAALMVLGEFDIDIGPALAGLGVVGIAVGFGAQSLVRDWFAGIFIVIENQYSQGDVVRIAGVEGVVEDFSLRRTTLRDLDGSMHTVPNGQIVVATNLARLWEPTAVEIRLADRGDSRQATRVLDTVGRELKADPNWSPRLVEAPSVVRVAADGTLHVAAQARAAEQESVRSELTKRAAVALKAAGIRTGRRRAGPRTPRKG